MAVSPDGRTLVSNSYANSGAVFLERDTSTGALGERRATKRCVTGSGSGGACETLAPLGGLGDVAISSDSRFEYLVSQDNGVLATFHVDAAPVCQPQAVAVPYQASVSIALSCSDVDGDPLTLSIVKQPTQGVLGGGGTIDPATSRVRYSPPLAYSGPDSFEFAATGRDVKSTPVRVSLDIGAPAAEGGAPPPAPAGPGASPPVAKRPVVPSTVRASWSVAKKRFTLRHLRLAKLVRGWKVTLSCKGSHCPFKRRAIVNKKRKRGGFDALKSLHKKTRFAAGQTITVTLSAPGFRTKRVTFRLKAGKQPRAVTRFAA